MPAATAQPCMAASCQACKDLMPLSPSIYAVLCSSGSSSRQPGSSCLKMHPRVLLRGLQVLGLSCSGL